MHSPRKIRDEVDGSWNTPQGLINAKNILSFIVCTELNPPTCAFIDNVYVNSIISYFSEAEMVSSFGESSYISAQLHRQLVNTAERIPTQRLLAVCP